MASQNCEEFPLNSISEVMPLNSPQTGSEDHSNENGSQVVPSQQIGAGENRKINLKNGFILSIIVIIGLILGWIFYAVFHTHSYECKSMVENGSCHETLPYRCPKEKKEEICELKIKFLQDEVSLQEVTFHEGVKGCENLGLTLWDVQNEEEWTAMIERFIPGYDYWLNLEPEPVNITKGQIESKKEEAGRGQGLPVRRKTDNLLSTYSRLFQVVTTDANNSCVYTENFWWKLGSCDLKKYVVCLKQRYK